MANQTNFAASSNYKTFTPTEYGNSEQSAGFGTTLTSFINSRSVMRGAAIDWDSSRLIKGKFSKYQQIGGEPLTLTTKIGDKISAFYFGVKDFHHSLQELGGKHVTLELHYDHPFFQGAESIQLTRTGGDSAIPGVRIPYENGLDSEFKNPKDFLEFCHLNRYTPYFENTLKPFQPSSWWHWSSKKQNLILLTKTDAQSLAKSSLKTPLKIQNSDKINTYFQIFEKKPLKARAIVFENNLSDIETLLSSRGLKVESSSWNMVPHRGKLYILDCPKVERALALSEMNGSDKSPLFRLATTPVKTFNLDEKRVTVILSMNQTNGFASYSHEVLTFLFSTMNVLVYDNAGKGLSTGSNSEQGMTEAIHTMGEFLIHEKGARQNQLIFKGQCAGGLPTAKAGELFPASHIWIDQAPKTFSGVTSSVVLDRAEKAKQSSESSWTKTFSSWIPYVTPVISVASTLLLPSYDVTRELKGNKGVQIYTIGVPDNRGYGGDKMVPLADQKEIQAHMENNPMGHYLSIEGGTHVTDWWLDPTVAKSARKIFDDHGFTINVFPETPKTPEEALSRRFENSFGHRFNPSRATPNEKRIHTVYVAAMKQDLKTMDHILHHDSTVAYTPQGLRDDISHKTYTSILNDSIDLSIELGHHDFAKQLLTEKQKGAL